MTVEQILELLKQKADHERNMAHERRMDMQEWEHRHAQNVLETIIEEIEKDAP